MSFFHVFISSLNYEILYHQFICLELLEFLLFAMSSKPIPPWKSTTLVWCSWSHGQFQLMDTCKTSRVYNFLMLKLAKGKYDTPKELWYSHNLCIGIDVSCTWRGITFPYVEHSLLNYMSLAIFCAELYIH